MVGCNEMSHHGYCEIPLSRGLTAKVDAEDYPSVSAFKWTARERSTDRGKFYASRAVRLEGGKRTILSLHRAILDAPAGAHVDHRNGDGLDCRRSNLRIATPTQNSANTKVRTRNKTGYKGVYKRRRKYWAVLTQSGKRIYMGGFDTAIEAARAFDAKSLEVNGEFAWLNFPGSATPLATSDGGIE